MADGIVINVNPKATYRRPGQINKRNAILSKPNAPLSYRPKVLSRNKAVLNNPRRSETRLDKKSIGGGRTHWSHKRQHVSYRTEEVAPVVLNKPAQVLSKASSPLNKVSKPKTVSSLLNKPKTTAIAPETNKSTLTLGAKLNADYNKRVALRTKKSQDLNKPKPESTLSSRSSQLRPILPEETKPKKKFKKPNYANKQIMGLNATFDKNTQTPGTQFPSNPYESVAGSDSMMGGFGGGIPGGSIVAPNEKEKNYVTKKTFSKFKKELVKEGGFVDAPGYDGSPTQDGPSMGTVSSMVTIDSPKKKKMKKVVEARMTGRDKLAKLMQPHLNAMGDTAAKLKKNADDYAAVVAKHPAKPKKVEGSPTLPTSTPYSEHVNCGTPDCCNKCDTAISELSVPAGTTGKRKKVYTSLVDIRMANGKIKKLPPGKSGSSGGGGGSA